MRSAIRYCVAAGAALGGASVIIAAPATPPLRDVQVPALELSGNMHDSPDTDNSSATDLLQSMNGSEAPVVVQNITEPQSGVFQGDTPEFVPGLSDLLKLGSDPAGPSGPQSTPFIDLGPLAPGAVTPAPPGPQAGS